MVIFHTLQRRRVKQTGSSSLACTAAALAVAFTVKSGPCARVPACKEKQSSAGEMTDFLFPFFKHFLHPFGVISNLKQSAASPVFWKKKVQGDCCLGFK